jgi:luciferase family oxidoreductase group 1
MRPPRVSALDLSPIVSGSSAGDALRSTIDLARHVERLGFTRYWLAEHHNAGSLASSSPEILIGLVAQATRALRVGSGGIMLPNHSALKVAEWFRLLGALFPDRIDLGLGRAPGTDARTARILRRDASAAAEDFVTLFDDLSAYLADAQSSASASIPAGPARVRAIPTGVAPPDLWILGSSDYGAEFAARRGLGFAFARHINPTDAVAVLRAYRAGFRPSAARREPAAILALSVVCAETDDEAEELAACVDLSTTRFFRGIRDLPFPSVAEARAHTYDAEEEGLRRFHRERHIVGSPARVRDEILSLAMASAADEIMIMTQAHEHAKRRRSYELVARSLGVEPARSTVG